MWHLTTKFLTRLQLSCSRCAHAALSAEIVTFGTWFLFSVLPKHGIVILQAGGLHNNSRDVEQIKKCFIFFTFSAERKWNPCLPMTTPPFSEYLSCTKKLELHLCLFLCMNLPDGDTKGHSLHRATLAVAHIFRKTSWTVTEIWNVN